MILAAADSAQYDAPPGELLQLALDCIQWHSLPRGGGVEGQKAGLLRKLRILANVYNSFTGMLNTKLDQGAWSRANPQMWAIVAHVQRMRVEHGGY